MNSSLIVVNDDIKYEVLECGGGVEIEIDVCQEEKIPFEALSTDSDSYNCIKEDDKWYRFDMEMEAFLTNASVTLNKNDKIKEAKKIAQKLGIKNIMKCKSVMAEILGKCEEPVREDTKTSEMDCAGVRKSKRMKVKPCTLESFITNNDVKNEVNLPRILSRKESRERYAASKKLEVIKFAEEMGGNRAASRNFNIPEGCIRNWRLKKHKLEGAKGTKLAFRGCKGKWAAVDNRLMDEINQKGKDSPDLSKKWIVTEAENIAKKLKVPNFRASSCWYSGFTTRNNLTITNRSKIERRKSYTTDFKLKVIKFAEEKGGNRAASRHFNIIESNVRKWRKIKCELEREDYVPYKPAGLKEQWPELEEKLKNFITERQDKQYSEELRKANIIHQAKLFASELNITNFTGSSSWFFHFLKRKNLKGCVTKRADYARASYTTQFKLEVVKFAEENGYKSAMQTYGINRSSIGIWHKSRQILEQTEGHRKSLRCCFNGKYVDLEDKLCKYAVEHESECCGVTEHQLRSKARVIAQEMKLDGFRESQGWFDRFLKRKGIKLRGETNQNSDEVFHRNENGYICGICCKVFEKQYHYKLHIALHIEGTENLCHICGKTYEKID